MHKTKKAAFLSLIILIIIIAALLLRPRHIKLDLSDNSNISIVREGNEISLTSDEKSQLIDIVEDITVMPCYLRLHLDGLTEYYIPAQTIVLTALLCLTIKSQLTE
ncbi:MULTISPECIES: hypothetical protein [Clostridia]|uniref:hypothetical protein n=1 Tax=Clostridia TaxID=186801 RepID=UPI000E50FBA4|nr:MULTISPECIES: hypothetical protein [Clostridia]RGZ64270.1 hypothetical protein DW979_11305 [Eubacterium sp. AM49-13BH]RGZ89124.1 hypothetical protein DW963_11340 [Eubacterium sp. AM46-8]RHK52486.1 hypothetical protein DW057_10225 [Lachnospira eligens]RHK85840.1 hypothetical protein DW044_08310 [Lachnospira eligens]